jgi:hypothetical protein
MTEKARDEAAREKRNTTIRKTIEQLRKGERVPPRSPRDFTEEATRKDQGDEDEEGSS